MSPMPGCRPAPAASAALREATTLWPNRRTASDGICGDPRHAAGVSDHNPDASGFAHAWDLTHDPDSGCDCNTLAELLKASGDTRIKYIIWNRRIWNPSISPDWRPYSGSNPHTSHMHVSIHSTPAVRNNISKWFYIRKENIPLPDNPDLPNIEGPLQLEVFQDANGICTGYAIFSIKTGELHGFGPGWRYYGRSEDPTPDA